MIIIINTSRYLQFGVNFHHIKEILLCQYKLHREPIMKIKTNIFTFFNVKFKLLKNNF